MGTIANKLSRILQTKKDIQKALVRNGKYVPDKLPFRYYPDLIDNMNIDGLIGMYYGKGLTNEELSKDPTWYDTSGNGNDLKFKNFAWRLDSGAGIFIYDFTKWNSNMGGLTSVQRTSNKIQFKGSSNASVGNVYDSIIRNIGYNYNFKIKITGLKSGNKVSIRKGASSIFMEITQDGVYYINTTVEEDWDQKRLYMFVSSYAGPDINLTIEQIPDYEGAICFNGIDDYAICDNFPILTKEKGYTVMALRKWLTFNDTGYISLVSNSTERTGAFCFEDFISTRKLTWSWEGANSVDVHTSVYTYQTSNSYNDKIINIGSAENGNNVLQVCHLGVNYANAAIYALCIIDHDTSDAEREIVINKWKQYYPELFFDQAWTEIGKTNDDEDRATVKNLTGNGNDLVLSNFAFTEESGYNSEGYLVTDGVDDKIQSSSFELGNDWTMVGNWILLQDTYKPTGVIKSPSLYIYNDVSGMVIYIKSGSIQNRLQKIKSFYAVCSDGRVYDNNWNEYQLTIGSVSNSLSGLRLGVSTDDLKFTKIAFKNIAIYNGKVLTKDQCIKAYNYLQTFKAK